MAQLDLGSGIPCRLCGLDAVATAKARCSYLKEPRLRRVSAQGCSEDRHPIEP
jgi:ribosomal protein L37E